MTSPSAKKSDLVIRPCHAVAEFEAMVDTQLRVWGYAERDVVSSHLFVVAAESGGQVMGAFVKDELIGFTLAFGAIRDGRPYLHSHLAAVLPEYRDRGVGRDLKLAQRDEALSRRIDLIEWTFDPLQPKNAYLNVCRLGAILRRYLPNVYGMSSSPLHHGIPTDRVIAEWHLNSARVETILEGHAPQLGSSIERVQIQSGALDLSAEELQKVQRRLRNQLVTLFNRNYSATWFERNASGGAYLLEPAPH